MAIKRIPFFFRSHRSLIPTARRLYKNTILESLSLAVRFVDATVNLPPPDFWPLDAPALDLLRLDLCPTPSTA